MAEMCGIAGISGTERRGEWRAQLAAMVARQHHRGPDGFGQMEVAGGRALLGHRRLGIIDLSPEGLQPMRSADGRYRIVFNGEIYNHPELREELGDYPFRGRTDTEVLLAAWCRWGPACLDRLHGMFAFLIWDEVEERLFAVRDRFGVKPLYYHLSAAGTLRVASEIKALHAAGVAVAADEVTWATWLASGLHEDTEATFWEGVRMLRPGHYLRFTPGAEEAGRLALTRWYRLEERVGDEDDPRAEEIVTTEYLERLRESVRLRFRSDVPVGICLSGGLDSSLLFRLVSEVRGGAEVMAYTFTTGDARYDERPWVERMLAGGAGQLPGCSLPDGRLIDCRLTPAMVPELAVTIQENADEPFGGIPTLAYARIFAVARERGTIVLLDGQGMDEQWGGYDYYAGAGSGAAIVQGSRDRTTRPESLVPELARQARRLPAVEPFRDRLRNLQYRDLCLTKLPRALRFNERISMRASTELREPFLDHRLVELALRQPAERKIRNGQGKWLLRRMAAGLLPTGIELAPKRAVQTPQREWLRGPLRDWATGMIDQALGGPLGGYFEAKVVRRERERFLTGAGDNSYFIWQWISAGLMGDLINERRRESQRSPGVER